MIRRTRHTPGVQRCTWIFARNFGGNPWRKRLLHSLRNVWHVNKWKPTTCWNVATIAHSGAEMGTHQYRFCREFSKIPKREHRNLGNCGSTHQVSTLLANQDDVRTRQISKTIHQGDRKVAWNSCAHHFRLRYPLHIKLLDEFARSHGNSIEV